MAAARAEASMTQAREAAPVATAVVTSETLIRAISERATAIDRPAGLSPLVSKVKNARVVMLGEATHGTREFYELRRQLTLELVEHHGFNVIAVEGDWPDCQQLNEYLNHGTGHSAREVLLGFHRWPTWMWANEEISKLIEALRGRSVGFYGLDVYSLFESVAEVTRALERGNPFLARQLRNRYACFEPFQRDGVAYARSLFYEPKGCSEQVLQNLEELMNYRATQASERQRTLFSAEQNARVAVSAERYYRAMLHNDELSWNIRDEHMVETLLRLLEHHGPESKAIVWAHNTHVGDYRATEMLEEGYVNLGGLARERLGSDSVALVGFGTFEGEVTAAHAWDGPELRLAVPRAREGSIEHAFHVAGERLDASQLLLLFSEELRDPGPLSQRHGHRAIGVVYDPAHERRGNYVATSLSNRYDAFVFVDKTSALPSLGGMYSYGQIPDTWPAGQ